MVNQDVDGYAKNPKSPENAKKQQPTKNQKNNKTEI